MSTSTWLGDRYELRGVLGRGGMAEVRDGWDSRLGRAVAIKLLHTGFNEDTDSRRRFEAEARSAAALTHPNIVAVYDSGEYDGTQYIVMERLPGATLADQIAQSPMPQAQVRAVLDVVLSALSTAHRAGILHRDIKPGNILFTADGQPKIADFGIAKTAESSHTQTGQIVGTLAYLSPDRLIGKPAAVTDDLYALGCVGYEALTGRKPFPDESLGALTRAILYDTPPPLRAVHPDVDPALAAVIERAMARDPQYRFPDADAMRASLWNPARAPVSTPTRPPTSVLTSPFAAAPPSGYLTPTAAPGPNRRVAKVAAGVGIISVFAVAVVLLVMNSPLHDDTVDTAPAATSTTVAPAPVTSTPITTTPVPVANDPPANNPPANGNGNGKGEHGKGKDKH
ncbi:MAG: protein kinase [Mycobacterium sp.]